MKNLRQIIFAVALTGTLVLGGSVRAETVDRVVAVVNAEPITLYQLDKAMSQNIDQLKKIAGRLEKQDKFKDMRSLALKRIIDETLLNQELKKRKIEVSDEDVQKAIGNVLDRNKITQDQLIKELQAKGTSWAEYQVQLKEQIKRIKFMGQVIAPRVKVTDADLDEFFAKNQDKFAHYQSVEMAQIIVPLKPDASDGELVSANQLAQEIIKKVKDGSDFEELGKKYSVNSQTAEKQVYPVAQLAPQIAAILSDLGAGGVSEPVRSTLGLHIIKLYKRKTLAGEEFKVIREQVREKVFEYKMDEEMQEYIDNLKDSSFIDIKA